MLSSASSLVKVWLRPFRTLGAFAMLWLLTLAAGIAISAVAYTYFKHTVLQPLALAQADQLYAIVRAPTPSNLAKNASQAAPDYSLLTRGKLFEINAIKGVSAAGSMRQVQRLSGSGVAAEQIALLYVSPNWLRVLGAKPVLGRRFARIDCDSENVMISEALWRSRFNRDREIVGRTIDVAGEAKIIIGVVPSSVQRVAPEAIFSASKFADLARDQDFSLSVIARRFTALSAENMDATLNRAALNVRATNLHTERNSAMRSTLTPVLALVALLALLIACNASSLFAVSVLERMQALAIEVALGAKLPRLLAQIAGQSLIFTGFATLFAVPLCPLLFTAARQHFLSSTRAVAELTFDFNSLFIVAAIFALLNLAAALLPTAAILRRINLNRNDRAGLSTFGAHFARAALAFQLVAATAVILLSLLLVRTLHNLNQVDPGFDLAHLWSAQIVLPNRSDTGKPEKNLAAVLANVEFMDAVQREVAKIPGVRAASFASDVPLGEANEPRGKRVNLAVDGAHADASGTLPYAQLRAVDSHYLDALGLKPIAGRLPIVRRNDANEKTDIAQEVAVNQSFVARFMPGVNPINRRVIGHNARIVGVLPAFKQQALSQPSEPDLYTPMALQPLTEVSLLVRTQSNTPPAGIEDQIRQIVHRADQNVPLAGALNGARLRDASIQDRINLSRVLTLFAALSVLTTALGLFSLSAYSVTKRVREFGLRLAVGAEPKRLLREVLFENLRFSGACASAGLVLGALLSELVANKLYAVHWFDWRSAVGAVLLMQLVCVLAAVIPAWRASLTDPLTALRD